MFSRTSLVINEQRILANVENMDVFFTPAISVN